MFFPAGTDVNTVDKTGLTPLAWAAAHRQVGTEKEKSDSWPQAHRFVHFFFALFESKCMKK